MSFDPELPLLEHLAERLSSLRQSERRVGALVADNPGFVIDSTMAAVADAAGVSEPTVMRFCTSLGFDGFQQFKMTLAQTVALGLPPTLSSINADDSITTITTKVFDHTISSMDRARRYLDPDAMSAAVDLIVPATELQFIGQGASGMVASDAAQKSVLFGLPCISSPDPHQQFMSAALAGEGTVLIAFSNTGRSRSTIDVARAAKASGADVIAVTGDAESPLAVDSDLHLLVRTFEDTDTVTPTVSRSAALVVVDVLSTAVSLRRGSDYAHKLSAMKEQLTKFRSRTGS